MSKLHTFGCSVTQGYALPDVVKPIVNPQTGFPYTAEEIDRLGIKFDWNDIHVYAPSDYAWPSVLANMLNMPVTNHARRGACFQQIARQCAAAAADIEPTDTVIVMWTYLQRFSLQWPARTAMPLCSVVDPYFGWRTITLGFNKLFGLERSNDSREEKSIQTWIEQATRETYLDPKSTYDRYYNSLVLQIMTDGFLRATGARVIHLSVEKQPVQQQLELARQALAGSLREPYNTANPNEWYNLTVDYGCAPTLFDPNIPPAENDMHPSVTHHRNFAQLIHRRYFQ